MSRTPRLPNPAGRPISARALRRKLSPSMIAGLRWYKLSLGTMPSAATRRSLFVRDLITAIDGDSDELTPAGERALEGASALVSRR